MGFFDIFLAGAAIAPLALLPPYCTVTTKTSVQATTSIQLSTLTYEGPFSDDPLTIFDISLATFTTVVPTEGPGGVTGEQTYTLIASPSVMIVTPTARPSSSSPSASPSPTTYPSTSPSTAPSVLPSTSQSTLPPTSVSRSASTSPSAAPPLSTDVPNGTYVGCFKDTTKGGRSLLYGPSASLGAQEACQAFCRIATGGPYKYFSIGPDSDCQCGQSFNYGDLQIGQCTSGCAGNVTQECGGLPDNVSVWTITPIYKPPPNFPNRPPSSSGDGVDDSPERPSKKPHPRPSSHKPSKPKPSQTKYDRYPQQTPPKPGYYAMDPYSIMNDGKDH